MAEVITVSALNQYVKTLLDANDILFDLALRGEIANFVQNARSGHCYFSLRDASASVKAVMFRSDARRLGFRPEEGMKVVVRCRATLYERDGAFQIYVNEMFPDGIGEAQLAFEQLKAKLEQEGLFAAEHKKPLPAYPKCIGVVTSKTGIESLSSAMGFTTPFKSFSDVKSDNPLVQAAVEDQNSDKIAVSWNFTMMPSEEWKNQLGSALLEYAQGTGDWDAVKTAFVDGWKTEYDASH